MNLDFNPKTFQMRLIPNTKATFGKQLPQRVSMLKNLVSRLIINEQVVTSKARALAIRPIAELIISNALSGKQDLKAEAEEWLVVSTLKYLTTTHY
jgi:ribosomal protein L17